MANVTELLDAFEAWDGTLDQATELRTQLSKAGPLRPSETPRIGERALAKFSALYQSTKKGGASAGNWLAENPTEAAIVAPLIGDPSLGPWPFHRPFDISEADARTWLRVLRYGPPCLDSATRRFLRIMLQVRRRETWLEAASTFGHLAHGDPELRGHLRSLWEFCWPDGLPKRWPKGGAAGLSPQATQHDRDFTHVPRHTFVCACAYIASRPGDRTPELLEAFDLSRLLHMQLPKLDADRSVVLRGLQTLLSGPDRAGVVAALTRRASELGADVMAEEALRDIAVELDMDVVSEVTCYEAIREALVRPRWRPARHDALWCWLETARWFRSRGDTDAVERILENAGQAKPTLLMGLSEMPGSVAGSVAGSVDPSSTAEAQQVQALRQRLSILLDRDSLHVTAPTERARLLCETRVLLNTPHIKGLDWPTLVRLATRGEVGAKNEPTESEAPANTGSGLDEFPGAMAGKVADVGLPSLGVMLSHSKMTSRTLMRGNVLSREAVLAVAAIDDGFVATQVAVHGERLLREIARQHPGRRGRDEQVRFLWQLLENNPPARTFEELDLVLRRELDFDQVRHEADPAMQREALQTQALRSVIRAVSALDQIRGQGALERTVEHLAQLMRTTNALVDSETADPTVATEERPDMEAIASDLEAMVQVAQAPLDEDWWEAFVAILLGAHRDSGLVGWALWLEEADGMAREQRRLGVEKVVRQLHAAVQLVRSAKPSVTAHHFEELQAATAALLPALGPLGWPEQTVLRGLSKRLLDDARQALEEGRKSRAVAEMTRQQLAREDESSLEGLAQDTESLALLPATMLRDVHFFLLKHMLFSSARRLRANCAERLPLPSPTGWMMPLYGAVAGGTFLVLDVGEAWLDLVKEGAWVRYGATVGLTLLASFLLMAGSSGTVSAKGGRLTRAIRHGVRVVPTYLIALTVAMSVAAIAMGTLGRFQAEHSHWLLLIWSSLSLFLGVFVGLIVQGQGITKRSDSG